MTLSLNHFLRALSLLCGLILVSACQQQNVIPTVPKQPKVLNAAPPMVQPVEKIETVEEAEKVMVIAMDLTDKKVPAPRSANPLSLDPDQDSVSLMPSENTPADSEQTSDNANKNLAILFSNSPKQMTTELPTFEQQSIIEITGDEQSLPEPLDRELQKIYLMPKAIQYAYLLDMAEQVLALGYAQSSARILNQIDLGLVPKNQLSRYLEAKAESQLKLGDSFGAITWLQQAQVLTPDTDPQARTKLLVLKAESYEANGLSLAAANALIALSQLPTTIEPRQYNERIWMALTKVNAQALDLQVTGADNDVNRAWYTLALIPLVHHDMELQLSSVKQWQQQWPLHPASLSLPGALASLTDLRATQPQRIALAMPLHGRLGKVGQAVVDGFMMARFEAQKTSAMIPYIKVYDTSSLNSLDGLYRQAAADQIDIIIGPLDKDKVIQLSQKDALTIPTLALNYIPLGGRSNVTTNLIQFGLAVEDEASQLADRSLAEGHKRIIVLHQDQPWATKAAQHFSTSWTSLGGEIATQVSFSGAGDHSESITQALLINQSHERAKLLKKHLSGSGNKVKFEPRRRQDVDAIVLFALPSDGRQIIPTLAFHYAADLPVYASHHIYQGPTSTSRDRDLEKVIFTELPWLIEQPEIQQKFSQKWPDRDRYTRLFAMGVDAYRLFPRLQQLQAFNNSRVHGVTGLLQMNSQGRIFTHSSWGQFRAGKVIANPR
jgi:outer membrane PBP1 activator LpoA protein